MSILSPDFRQGKARGITWNILNSFKDYREKRRLLTSCSDDKLQDQVFLRMARQPNLSVLTFAVELFNLRDNAMRYKGGVLTLCGEGHYKGACDAAVALRLYDQFEIKHFCVPLLLLDNSSTLELYLNNSPVSANSLVKFLDDLSVDSCIQVSEIIQRYPQIKPIGASKLSGKPLDKMIKKYAEKWNIPTGSYPLSSDRWAKSDLYYWIKQMFGYEETQLQLTNWREIIEKKVGENKELQKKLVSELFRFDTNEANFWAAKFGMEDQIVHPAHEDEEDWDADCASVVPKPATVDYPENIEETKVDEDIYLQLPFPESNVIMVDTRDKYLMFLNELETSSDPIIGLDAEFMCSRGEQNLSLLQISLTEKVYLLDWELLPPLLEHSDYVSLRDKLFIENKFLIVGFGIVADVKLLSKSFKQFEDISKKCTRILDLECVKTSLMALLRVQTSSVRGLSGVCKAVLGKPLSKAEQIGDWTKRPLRQAQLVYAALDAWVCIEIYRTLRELAVSKKLENKFMEIVHKELKRASEPSKKKSKEKKVQDRVEAAAELEKLSSILQTPLLQTPSDPRSIKLVCDDMLQGLCRKLRMFGVDCLALDNGQDHLDCIKLATAGPEPRYVVSRGIAAARIAKHLPAGHTLNMRSNELVLQVEEVFRYFNIVVTDSDLFSRCVLCNGGHYYELSRYQLSQISDNIQRRKNLKNFSHVDPVDDCDDNDDLDGFRTDESDDDEFPAIKASGQSRPDHELGEETRWISVRVMSSLTGEERMAKVNIYTGDTEEEVTIQVEAVAKSTIEKYEQFWACGQCGKVYFEGSHWEKASQQAKKMIKN